MHSFPWLYGDDFNEVLSHNEKTGNNAFREPFSECGLQDIGIEGRNSFTWTNRGNLHLVLERLDHQRRKRQSRRRPKPKLKLFYGSS